MFRENHDKNWRNNWNIIPPPNLTHAQYVSFDNKIYHYGFKLIKFVLKLQQWTQTDKKASCSIKYLLIRLTLKRFPFYYFVVDSSLKQRILICTHRAKVIWNIVCCHFTYFLIRNKNFRLEIRISNFKKDLNWY